MPMQRDFSLLIDVGNTFLKWGLFRPSAHGTARENRVESGHALHEEITADYQDMIYAATVKEAVPRPTVR